MTYKSKEIILDEIIDYCRFACKPEIKRRYSLKKVQQILIDIRDMVKWFFSIQIRDNYGKTKKQWKNDASNSRSIL